MKAEQENKSQISVSTTSSRQVDIFVQFSGYKAWFKFFSERVALFVYLLTAAGYVLTANYCLTNGSKNLPLRQFFWTMVIETLFLVTLRAMDDLKDVDTVCLFLPFLSPPSAMAPFICDTLYPVW